MGDFGTAGLDALGGGGTLVFFNQRRVLSYAMARLKAERYYWDEADLRDCLAPGGSDHHFILPPDGAWWRFVQRFTAQLDGDTELAARLGEEEEARFAVLVQAMNAALAKVS
jgi:hypothetical protein